MNPRFLGATSLELEAALDELRLLLDNPSHEPPPHGSARARKDAHRSA
jgi:hypothetical protein